MPIMSDSRHGDGRDPQRAWRAGWRCPRCNEEVPEWFDTCWKCDGAKPTVARETTDRIVEIDGLLFSNLAEFSSHFAERSGLAPCCGSLDILNEVLSPDHGFGAPVGGFLIRWRNHAVSMERLGTLFHEIVAIVHVHGPDGPLAQDNVRLELL
jgi:hypothetical protein